MPLFLFLKAVSLSQQGPRRASQITIHPSTRIQQACEAIMKWIVSIPPFYIDMDEETMTAIIPDIEFVGMVDWDLIKQNDYLDDAFSAVLRIKYRSIQTSRSFLITFFGGDDGVATQSLMEINEPQIDESREIVNMQGPVPLVFEDSPPRPWVCAMEIKITIDNSSRAESLNPNHAICATISIKTPSECFVPPKPCRECTAVEDIENQMVSLRVYALGSWPT